MSATTPIQYMGFHDVPLIFIARYRGETYLFDCPFDEETEEKACFLSGEDGATSDSWNLTSQSCARCSGYAPASSRSRTASTAAAAACATASDTPRIAFAPNRLLFGVSSSSISFSSIPA